MTDRSKILYYEVYEIWGNWKWKIYHYDSTGIKEIVLHYSNLAFDEKEAAEGDCVLFMDDMNIYAQMR